jgi:type I restriction enzyme S subunit
MMFYKETKFANSKAGLIPKEWESTKLGSLLCLRNGQRPKVADKGPFPVFGANGIMGYSTEFLTDNDFTIVFGRVGASGEVHLGKGKLWISDNAIFSEKYDKNRAYPPYLSYLLKSKKLKQFASKTTHPIITKTFLDGFSVNIPPLVEQKAIVGVLGVVDSAIELADRVIAKTERLKKGLMQQLLTRGIGHTEYKDTPIGKIPKIWQVVRIGDVAETSSGGTPSRSKKEYFNGEFPWVKSGELKDNTLYAIEETISKEGLQNSAAKIFPKGTLLIALYGATVGKTGILGIDATTNQAVCAILPKGDVINPEFLKYFIISRREKLIAVSAGGAQPNISQEIIRSTYFPLPQPKEQHEIAEILSTLDKKLEVERAEKAKLENIKHGLMDLLLTGKVRIRVD